jgi:uncharacterized phiE125 gp8 family phage protein
MALRRARQIHDYRGNRLQTAPDNEPITLDELKTHLRITGSGEDTYLTGLIEEARQEIEDASGIAFITQEWLLTLDRWPAAREEWWDGVREAHIDVLYGGNRQNYASVRLPRYPLQTVDTITTYSEDGTATSVTIADVFDVDTQSLRGRLTIKRGATWPIALQANNAIEIAYTAGYGDTATAVPAPLKRAVRLMAAFLYEHRGDGCTPGDAYLMSGAKGILDRYRSVEV